MRTHLTVYPASGIDGCLDLENCIAPSTVVVRPGLFSFREAQLNSTPFPLAFHGFFSSRQVGERLFPQNSGPRHLLLKFKSKSKSSLVFQSLPPLKSD